MKFVFYTVCVSPHQLPLAQALIKVLGVDNYRYVYAEELTEERCKLGWGGKIPSWCVPYKGNEDLVETAEFLLSGVRDLALFKRRSASRLMTGYASERWFKPISLSGILIGGWLRMLWPRYLKMAIGFRHLVRGSEFMRVYPVGVFAWRDMRLLGIPATKMSMWGYFVAPSKQTEVTLHKTGIKGANATLKLLWVGRMVALKHVEKIIEAIRGLPNVTLTLVGDGPERIKWQNRAKGLPVVFRPSVPIDQVRSIMREHDVYVFCSDAQEGWGAVVNEAIEERMLVLGSREAGASATILPASHQFAAKDVLALRKLLRKVMSGELKPIGIGEWSAQAAAERILKEAGLS